MSFQKCRNNFIAVSLVKINLKFKGLLKKKKKKKMNRQFIAFI